MPEAERPERKRILDPMDRIIEAIFGIVMVLTFTCTFSAVEATRADVRSMLLAAIGCNVAWGLVDGVMYLVARVTQQLRGLETLKAVRAAAPAEGGRILSSALPPLVSEALGESGVADLRVRLIELPSAPERVRISVEDCLGAVGIFLIAVISMMPVLVPFIVMKEPHPAMRVSNGIALVMLFLLGQQWARLIGLPRWRVGISMALGGAVLVAITIALGG
ncbi:MAG: hypothetical protein WC538_15390 [Thermoanaerobaculia bacterium]|jgi:hypothetical protein